MNAHFVNIKVDREERPDLDQIYQTRARAADAALRRLAADDVPDAGRRAVLRRHVFPQAAALRPARLPRHAAQGRARRIASRAETIAAQNARLRACDGRRSSREATDAALRRGRAGARMARSSPRSFDPRARRIRRGAQVPARARSSSSACARMRHAATPKRCTSCARDAGANGRRRHPRPAGRRLLPLQRRRRMDDPALREDALRQRAAARAVRGYGASHRRRRVRATSRATSSAGWCARCAPPTARSIRASTPTAKARRAVLRLAARRSARGADARRVGRRRAVLRPRPSAQLRGPRVEPARRRRRSIDIAARLGIVPQADATRARLGARASFLRAARDARAAGPRRQDPDRRGTRSRSAGLARAARALDGRAWTELAFAALDALRAHRVARRPPARDAPAASARRSTPTSTTTRSCSRR